MKIPNFLDPLPIDRVRTGDWLAVAEALQKIQDAYNQQAQALAQRIGGWKKVEYSAGDFTAASGVWAVDSGDVKEMEFLVIDDVMFFHASIQNTTLSLDTSDLRVKIPGGYLAQSGTDARGSLTYNQGAVTAADVGTAAVNAAVAQTSILLARRTGNDWEGASPTVDVYFAIWLHIATPSGN